MNLIASISNPTARLPYNSSVIPTPRRGFVAATYRVHFFPFYSNISRNPFIALAKKKNSKSEPVPNPSIVEEVYVDDDDVIEGVEDEIFLEDFKADELVEDDEYLEDEYFTEEAEQFVGDGAGGGGIALSGTMWDKEALEIAEKVASSFDGELGIYAFKTLANASIQVRIERLTNKSGSPNMSDIEAFSTAYRDRLDEAEANGSIPGNVSLEVSSPGVERVVRIPEDLERFKERNLYVKYVDMDGEREADGVFRLVSFDIESKRCSWGLADVRANRDKAGKGRPLSKKQKEWRLDTPFQSLRLVRLYSDF